MFKIPSYITRWFPELLKIEDEKQRKIVWENAYASAYKMNILSSEGALGFVVVIAAFIIAVTILRLIPDLTLLDSLIPAIVSIIVTFSFIYLFKNRIDKSIREQLNEMSLPTCMKCGYDLRYLEEPRCPECGTTFEK